MRFRAHDHVIDLLVGQQLYSSADVALRELIQNAEDACELQRLFQKDYEARIVVRYSIAGNWVEVEDNGLGMNEEAVEKGFAAVGAPKSEVAHIRALLQQDARGRQIALFGIGVLSCFGVAESIVVRTKMDGNDGLAFRIADFHQDFVADQNIPDNRGTTVRLQLKHSGPMIAEKTPQVVERYVRHASHIEIENADTGERRPILEQWSIHEGAETVLVETTDIRRGVIALDPSWDLPETAIRTGLVICNSGFLVTERESNLLRPEAVGYAGELDIVPGSLTILLNREGFKQDDRWEQLRGTLVPIYNQALRKKLTIWEKQIAEKPRQAAEDYAIDRATLVLTHSQAAQIIEPDVMERLKKLRTAAVRIRLWDADDTISLATLLDRVRASAHRVVYYVRDGQRVRPIQHSLSDGTGTVQVTEVPETEGLRAIHLKAKGRIVVRCKARSYTIEIAGQTQTLSLNDSEIVGHEMQSIGVSWMAVQDAPAEDVQLGAVSESELLSNLLGLGKELNFALLNTSSQRVIRDFAGRFLNCAHPEVRELLRALPEAVGNPVRRALLQAYIDLDQYSWTQARTRIKDLLMDPELPEKAQLATGPLTLEYLKSRLEPLIEQSREQYD